MTGTPRVAIVIPSYNYARFLSEAIESALAQTHRPAEILVVDDGSTDASVAVARSYGPPVRCIVVPHGGPSRTRNAGLAAVTSPYVLFLDADDRLDPRYVERCLRALNAAPSAAFAYTQMRWFDRSEGVSAAPPYAVDALKRGNFIHASALQPTELLREVGYDPTMRGLEDWDLYLGLAELGVHGILVDEPLLHYRDHGKGLTGTLRSRPVRLLRTRLRIVLKHRSLYSRAELASQFAHELRQIGADVTSQGWGRRVMRQFKRTVDLS